LDSRDRQENGVDHSQGGTQAASVIWGLKHRLGPPVFEGGRMVSQDFIRQIEGYGLTTATILYRLPDHPKLLQTYIWQEYDLAPKFPVLLDFLDFWKRELEGPLHSVTVAHSKLIKPTEYRAVEGVLTLH
jgi:uncharacterized protein Usg